MHKEQSSLENALQIIRDVCERDVSKEKKTKRERKMVETDIDIFSEDEKEQYEI